MSNLPNFYRPSIIEARAKQQQVLQNGGTLIATNIPKLEFKLPKNGKEYDAMELREIGKAVVMKVEYPVEGGVFTYLRYYKYPYRGFPEKDSIWIMSVLKGVIPLAGMFGKELLKNPFTWLSIYFAVKKLFPKFVSYAHRILSDYYPENLRLYCKSVQAILKAFEAVGCDKDNQGEANYSFDLHVMADLRSVLCYMMEFDNAYRYRIQDAFGSLTVEELKKNPLKALFKAFDILIERERYPHMKQKWQGIKILLKFYLKVDRVKREQIKKIISNLDLNEIKLQEDDIYFIEARTDYNFQGKIR